MLATSTDRMPVRPFEPARLVFERLGLELELARAGLELELERERAGLELE